MARIPVWGKELKERIETGKGYQHGNEGKKATWRADYLKDLPTKQYGRSYDDKLTTFVKSMGGDEVEANRFRTWMNQRESGELQKNIDYQSRLTQIDRQAEENRRNQERFGGLVAQLQSVRDEPTRNTFMEDITTPLKNFGNFAKQSLNPTDGVNPYEAWQQNMQQNMQDSAATERSGITNELGRATSRILNTASLGALSNIEKRATGELNQAFESRQGGGNVADIAYDSLGYLIPGAGAYKAVGRLGQGATGAKRLGVEAAKGAGIGGALAGAEVGIREGLNPDDYTAQQNLTHLGIGVGAGAIADPLLYGVGKGVQRVLSRYATGDVPTFTGQASENVLEQLRPAERPSQGISDDLFNRLMNPKQETPTPKSTPKETPKPKPRDVEFDKAVEDQYNYLKSSLSNRKGVQQGGIIRNELGEVVDRYGRISENPGWYQEFYRQNNRQPTNKDLRELAEQHVREGFKDEFGEIPPYQAQKEPIEQIKPAKDLKSELERYGLKEVNSDNIARAYNQKTWYHGTGAKGLTAEDLDSAVTSHESLFGQGVYLTDNPEIAKGYSGARSKKTGTPTIYEANVDVDKVLDLESPVTPDVVNSLLNTTSQLDEFYQMESGYLGEFTSNLMRMADNGASTEEIITALRKGIKEFSEELEVPSSEFVEYFNDIAINLKEAGYDGITHTGGGRTGNDPHRVLILLDPNNTSSQGKEGRSHVSRFAEMVEPEEKPTVKTREKAENISAFKDGGVPMKRLKPEEKPKEPFKPVNIPNAKEIVKKQISTEGTKDKKKWSFDHFMTAVVDDLRPIHKATKELGGKDLSFDKDPYKQARNARGVAGKAESYIYGGVFDENGKKVGKSLQEIIKPVEKNMDDFLVYLTSKRAIDYDEKGLIAGIKPKDVENISDRQLAEAAIKQLEKQYPHFKDAQKAFVEYNQRILKEVADSGYYTKKQLEEIIKGNENYVPMNRVQEPKVRGFEPIYPKNRYANLSDPLKKRTGSQKPIINPVESAIKNTYMLTNIAERNKVGASLLELVENAPDNMWGRVVGTEKGGLDDLSKALKEGADQLDEGKMDAVDNLFKGKGNEVYVYRNGEKVKMELQEDLYKAMLSLDAQKQNFFIKMLSVPTKTLRAGAVLSPDFGPVNIFRDQFSAFVNSKYGFVPFVDMFKGLSNVLKKDEVYWQWKKSGGANSILSTLDREYLQKDLRKMIKEPVGQKIKRNFKKGNKRELPMKALNLALEPLRTVSSITEEATRLGEFKKGLKKGASPQEAAFASRDLIDFNRAGNLGRQYNQITAFFNAAVQSMDKTARTFKENPVGASIRAFSLVTLPSIVAYAYNHDKEWYKEIPQKDRDLYWHFEIGGQIYKLPKPFEVGVMFGTTAERFYEWLQTNDKEAFKGYVDTVKDTFTPPWLPTAVTPWMEVWANKSTYFDSPIVPRREQELNPEDQYGPYQSEVSKAAGNLTKTSPRKIEHVFKGYTGGLGKYALSISDHAANAMGANRPEMPDRGVADLPVVNRFVVKNLEGNNQSVDDFYKTLDKIKRERNSAKKNDTSYNDTLYKSLNKLSREISELQSDKRDIIADEVMSGKTKAERIRELDRMITNLARQGVNESK